MIRLLGLFVVINIYYGVDGTCNQCTSCLYMSTNGISNDYDTCAGGEVQSIPYGIDNGCHKVCNAEAYYELYDVCPPTLDSSEDFDICACPAEKPVLLTFGSHINGICITKTKCDDLKRIYGRELDHDSCPDPTSEEYFQLQQIDFLYSDGNNTDRCFEECQQCRLEKSHCNIEKLENHIIEKAFGGLFYSSPEAYIESGKCIETEQEGNDRGKSIPVQCCEGKGKKRGGCKKKRRGREVEGVGEEEMVREGEEEEITFEWASRNRRNAKKTCIRDQEIKTFRKKEDGWYAVHFIDTIQPEKGQFQYYEQVKCKSSKNKCYTKNTVRTFLMTTKEPGVRGHLYAFFTNWGDLFSNIKFQTFNLPGHCFRS